VKAITHDGQEYVLRSDLEASFKDRISKLSTRATQAEEQAQSLQAELDNQAGRLSSIETLSQQIEEYKTQLAQSNARYDRHSAMAQHGWTDPDLRDAVEWAFDRAMNNTAKKDQVPLSDWLDSIKADPSQAPAILRPHLSGKTESDSVTEAAPAMAEPEPSSPMLPPQAPSSNRGAQPAPAAPGDILARAAQDLDFYRENREAVKKAWSRR
jgi:hypothetical protein